MKYLAMYLRIFTLAERKWKFCFKWTEKGLGESAQYRYTVTRIKGIFQQFEPGSETRFIRSAVLNWGPGKLKIYFFNDTISREEHKTILSGLRISKMTLSNQIYLPGFFSPRKVNSKILIISGLGQAGIAGPQKITLGSWFHHILFSDLARWLFGVAKSRKMTYRSLANSGLS